MNERRAERVQENIRREVAMILARDFLFPGVFLTVTRVKISSDGFYADIFFVTAPRPGGAEAALVELRKNIFSIQQALNKRLRMRPVPKLRFCIDRTEQEAARIDEIMERLK